MKIVVLGARGLLGQALCRTLPGELVPLGHAEADLTRPVELRAKIKEISPRIVFNAAGLTEVDRAEAEPKLASQVNAFAARDLAAICRDLDCTLIHFSTNYVFGADSERRTPYDETDKPGPLNRYGRTKFEGEMFVRSLCRKYFIIRTCGLYGPMHDDSARVTFVKRMLQKASVGEAIRVVNDQTSTPTAVRDFVEALLPLLESDKYGLYHVTNSGACTWLEFAQTIFALRGIKANLTGVTSEEFRAPGMRPRYSVLNCSLWGESGFTRLRPWQDALAATLQDAG